MVSDFWGLVAYVLGFRIQGLGVSGFVVWGTCTITTAATLLRRRLQRTGIKRTEHLHRYQTDTFLLNPKDDNAIASASARHPKSHHVGYKVESLGLGFRVEGFIRV